jgi:hypothetical protein
MVLFEGLSEFVADVTKPGKRWLLKQHRSNPQRQRD